MEDQYSRARMAVQRVFERFPEKSGKAIRFYTTGHSLGGGLAQHVLYSYPDKVTQALVFDPSSVTGFADQPLTNQVSACQCSAGELNGEPRIFRVDDAYEVLANLRIFHKTFLPPERYIQEVRFSNAASHSITCLVFYLLSNANSATDSAVPRSLGMGNYTSSETCTAAFVNSQRSSCEAKVATHDQWHACPQ